MTGLDWAVLVGTIGLIVGYGAWRSRRVASADEYLRGGYDLRWPTIGLSVMATQASAITFLSTPGQGWDDGLRFVQFYFGLPIAMVLVSAFIVPAFFRSRVYTAYEYLGRRFDPKTRALGAILFLIQRGLAAGITIYAPAIILSTILGWSLNATIVAIGGVVIIYTVFGGSRAVSQTQKHQMVVMLGGMVVAAVATVALLPDHVEFADALDLAGALGRLDAIDFSFRLEDRYNVWSGITGGTFLALAYFGTDQSQVQRYLSGRSITESRLGLLFNGVLKIPMQLLILFTGVMVCVFHLFAPSPVFHNAPALRDAQQAAPAAMAAVEREWSAATTTRRLAAERLVAARRSGDEAARQEARRDVAAAQEAADAVRKTAKVAIVDAVPGTEKHDTDYVFIGFVLHYLPAGLVGLLIAVILCAAMSSTSSELNALATTTAVDLWARARHADPSDHQLLVATRTFTVIWGLVALAFATFASLVDNLIQAVNILGSIFYGTVLGLFLAAFFVRRIGGTAAFLAALVSQAVVAGLYFASDLGFLWYNVVGCTLVVVVGLALQPVVEKYATAR